MLKKNIKYKDEYFGLVREQYKRKPNFSKLMKVLGSQSQDVEDAVFDVMSLGAIETLPNDALIQTAIMLGIKRPNSFTVENLILEIKATFISIFSNGDLSDLKRLPTELFEYDSDIAESGGGIVFTIYGDISSNSGEKARIIYKFAKRMISVSLEIHSINEALKTSFGFKNFTTGSGFVDNQPDPIKNFSKVIVTNKGKVII